MGFQGAHGIATKATFEDIHAPQFLSFLQDIGNAAKIVVPAAMSFSPLHAVPLQEVIGHQVALLIRRCTIHIPTPTPVEEHDNTGNSLPLEFGQEEGCPVSLAEQAHDIFIVSFVMNEELVAFAGSLINAIERIQVCLALSTTYGDAFTPSQADIVAPLLLHACKQGLFIWS